MPDFHVARAGTPSTPICLSGDPRIYGRVPIYTDGAGWYSDACGWAGVERVVYGHPLRNLMSAQRVLQNAKEGSEAFDDPFPVGERGFASGRAFERVLNWLSALTLTQDFAFEKGDPKSPPLAWKEDGMPPWLNETRRTLRL